MTVEEPGIESGQALCCMYTKLGIGTTQCYSASQINASDDRGDLNIKTADDSGSIRSYLVTRPTYGNVVLMFVAYPVKVNSKTPIGGRMELRQDQRGLQCMGFSTVPVPWDRSWDTKDRYSLKIEWDLSGAPVGTRGVSSFGEGIVRRRCAATDLWRMIFAVGPLNSYPSADEDKSDSFGFYWFGTAPEQIASLPPLCEELFTKMSEFFQDKLSADNPYRIFVRRVTPARGFGGSGGLRSVVLEYDEAIGTIIKDEVFNLLAHEIVHNWPLLLPGPKDKDLDLVAWFNEGIADYYGTILPYRFGLRSESEFITRLNAKLTQYYTNPHIEATNREALEKGWTDTNLLTLPYTRGMLYLSKVDYQIRKATSDSKTVDTLILSILDRTKKQEPHSLVEWKAMIEELLGSEALKELEAMNDGETMRLPIDCFGTDWKLLPVDQRVLDFGFDMSSFQTRIISGLKSGSQAAKAGLRNGDEMVRNAYTWQCQEEYERSMEMTVKRGEELFDVKYWPRSEVMAESWQLRKVEKSPQ
ncbi:hypothetical protein BDV96DRAFT_641034 [Lophiotrema nucula]|uniref:Peptidase M61 catalytic domain-containing protein n=1 Tax=Lophiotrema nucula TaxID=690887 RepID=A0A6A5ZPM9_9PLEO|nr:hypothetical protein BDV96DRAFT_641034 [Lophiotrema nucula]